MTFKTYQDVLNYEFENRRARNSSYSLRSLARDTKMVPSQLSEVLAGKKGLSYEKAEQICSHLKLSEPIKNLFLLSVLAQHAKSPALRKKSQSKLADLLLLKKEELRTSTITHWVSEFVLALTKIPGFELTVDSIYQQYKLPKPKIEGAYRFLTRLGFINSSSKEKSYLAAKNKNRKLNVNCEQILDLAKSELNNPHYSQLYKHEPLLIDESKTEEAQQIILQCYLDLKKLESKTNKSKFFYFSTQLFSPVKKRSLHD